MAEKREYEVLRAIDASAVPGGGGRPSKWGELVERVVKLAPGKALPVVFREEASALRARSVVRARANARLGRRTIRTRLVQDEEGNWVVYFVRRGK